MFQNPNPGASSGGLQQADASRPAASSSGQHYGDQHHFNGLANYPLGQPNATATLIIANRSQLNHQNLPQATQFYNPQEIAYVNMISAERFAGQPADYDESNLTRLERHTALTICDSNGAPARCAPKCQTVGADEPIQANCSTPAKRPSQFPNGSHDSNVINNDSNSVATCVNPVKGAGQRGKRAKGAEAHKERARNSRESPQSSRQTFACPTCSKHFTEKFNMKRHMQVHSHTRPKFACNECPKTFAWRDNFTRHRKAVHSERAGRPEVAFAAH